MRHRWRLVRMRTGLKNALQALVAKHNLHPPGRRLCGAPSWGSAACPSAPRTGELEGPLDLVELVAGVTHQSAGLADIVQLFSQLEHGELSGRAVHRPDLQELGSPSPPCSSGKKGFFSLQDLIGCCIATELSNKNFSSFFRPSKMLLGMSQCDKSTEEPG